jgi:hypothetical protein
MRHYCSENKPTFFIHTDILAIYFSNIHVNQNFGTLQSVEIQLCTQILPMKETCKLIRTNNNDRLNTKIEQQYLRLTILKMKVRRSNVNKI